MLLKTALLKRSFVSSVNGQQRTTISKLEINKENLNKSITPELFATDHAFREVENGIPFREAYRLVAENLEESKNSGIFILKEIGKLI